jgi:Undecaprenyl-phosphate glucose phosphotransferase
LSITTRGSVQSYSSRREELRRSEIPRALVLQLQERLQASPAQAVAVNSELSHGHALVSRHGGDSFLRGWKSTSAEALSAAIFLMDPLAILVTSVLSGMFYHEIVYYQAGDLLSYVHLGGFTVSVVVITNLFRGEYRLSNFLSFKPHLRSTARLWNATFVCLLVIGFFTKFTAIYSRGWIFLFYLFGFSVLLLLRYAAVKVVSYASRAGLIVTKRIFLLGTGKKIEEFIAKSQSWRIGVEIVGCQLFSAAALSASGEKRRQALRREFNQAIKSARHLGPDAIFVLAPWSDDETIDGCVETMLSLPAEIHLDLDHVFHKYPRIRLARLGPMCSLQLTRLPLSRFELLQKRVFDLLSAGLGLVFLAPFLALVAVLIKLDSPGPVFFLQQRYGFNQQHFRIIKFRTMRSLDDGAIVPQATRADPRVTRVGRWLRRLNIDEIPQLLNVLRGEMSLVGPRPHALSHNREYEQKIARYARRHNVKPGITGWAQVHGLRGETDTKEKMQQRVEHDLFYIDNWSISRDILILIKTVVSPASYRNAY